MEPALTTSFIKRNAKSFILKEHVCQQTLLPFYFSEFLKKAYTLGGCVSGGGAVQSESWRFDPWLFQSARRSILGQDTEP